MRNSLIFKLLGAFLLVIAIGALVSFSLSSLATRSAFNLYTTRSGQAWALQLAPVLADYYAVGQTWKGVDTVLSSGILPTGPGGMMGQGAGRGMGRQTENMMGMSGQRLILIDASGMVISDTQNELTGKQLSAAEIKNGAPITVNNQPVGTILVTPSDMATTGTPAAEFLTSVNQAIISSAVIAGIIALILGALLFFQITAPLRQLKKAAAAIAQGDLAQRVQISSRDELGELGQTFNHMAESLSAAETQRQHMVADVAHELRTPLAAIQATLEGMQDGVLPLDLEQVSALHSETLLLNRLVGDLRLISLAETGQLKLERSPIEPGALIQNVTERITAQANQKNIQLGVAIQPNLPEIWLDADRITQVLNNLLSNALRYTPEGGSISVQAALLPGGKFLQVSVSDTGPGIEAENLLYVFDRFYRADKSRTRSSGGSGLGLAIVKQLVEAHGGTVRAESPVFEQSYGTKISFILPYLHEA